MESESPSNMPALRNLCSPFSFWRSCSNRTPQHHKENPWDYERCKTETMKKPQIIRIFDIMELDMFLLNLINQTTNKLKTESNQNQLKQLIELIKMNVNLLIHEPDLQYIRKFDLEELDYLLAASHTTDQASTQHDHDPSVNNIEDLRKKLMKAEANAEQVGFDQNLIENIKKLIFGAEYKHSPVKTLKEIYKLLESAKAKANVGQVDFGQNLIKDIRRFIQQCHEELQAEDQLAPSVNIDPNKLNNDLAELIVNFLPVELRPASNKSNLNLVKCNLDLIHILLREESQAFSLKMLTNKLINVTKNLINQINIQISRVDCRVSSLQDGNNWEDIMKSHAARIIQLMCSPNVELYIDKMDSFKDICNQVAAMYKHSQRLKINKKDERRIDANYTWCGSFREDILKGNCKGVEEFLKENPLALTAKITVDGNTALHVAVQTVQPKMVRMLSEKLRKENRFIETLQKQNEKGNTVLYIAACGGEKLIAKELVKGNEDILLIEWYNDETIPWFPLFAAAKFDHKKMVEYLYVEMHQHKRSKEAQTSGEKVEFFPNEKWVKQWALFLAYLIYNEDYEMAVLVNQDYPNLAFIEYTEADTPLLALAQSRYLGANVTVESKASILQYFNSFPCGNKIVDDGTASKKASQLLREIILAIDDLKSQKPALKAAFFKAAEIGSVEFVAIFIKSLPVVLSWSNDLNQNIFHVAIINRQENIFNLIYRLDSVKNDLTGSPDKFNNWMLHLAGEIAPLKRLNQLSGPILQLQRELQWFQAVKDIVPNNSIDAKTLRGETPSELFTSKHEGMMKVEEKWMRNTASQCSIVAALITTVMFAAAFTLPGGNNDDTGDPMFLRDISFLLFAVADLVAFSTSCTSLLIFLAILTSRFTENDFLISLPKKLFTGLVLLFVSMAAMTFAFCDTIYIVIHNQFHWFCIPIIVSVGLIPVLTFSRMMFPLLFELWRATATSIFYKSPRTRMY